MSSYPRRLQRKAARKSKDYEGREQPVIMLRDGGYRTLRPTKRWITISGARLRAQRRMARILGA